MNIRQNLFGQGPRSGREAPGGYSRAPPPPPRGDVPMMDGNDNSYGAPPQQPMRGSYGSPMQSPRQAIPSRPAVGRSPMSPTRRLQLRIAKVDDKTLANQYIFGNL